MPCTCISSRHTQGREGTSLVERVVLQGEHVDGALVRGAAQPVVAEDGSSQIKGQGTASADN